MKRRFDTHFFMTVVPPSISVPTESAEAIISEPIASADGKETVSADWLTPSEAMRRTLEHTRIQQAGETVHVDSSIILFPPQVCLPSDGPLDFVNRANLSSPQFYLLAELSETKSWRDLLDTSDVDLAGFPKVKERSIEPFEPEMRAVLTSRGEKRAATVLPGDPEHSMTKKMMPNAGPEARHRTYVLLPGKAKTEELKKKQPLGLTVMGKFHFFFFTPTPHAHLPCTLHSRSSTSNTSAVRRPNAESLAPFPLPSPRALVSS